MAWLAGWSIFPSLIVVHELRFENTVWIIIIVLYCFGERRDMEACASVVRLSDFRKHCASSALGWMQINHLGISKHSFVFTGIDILRMWVVCICMSVRKMEFEFSQWHIKASVVGLWQSPFLHWLAHVSADSLSFGLVWTKIPTIPSTGARIWTLIECNFSVFYI